MLNNMQWISKAYYQTIICQILIITKANSFLWAAEFSAEPQNIPFATEFLYRWVIMWNLINNSWLVQYLFKDVCILILTNMLHFNGIFRFPAIIKITSAADQWHTFIFLIFHFSHFSQPALHCLLIMVASMPRRSVNYYCSGFPVSGGV